MGVFIKDERIETAASILTIVASLLLILETEWTTKPLEYGLVVCSILFVVEYFYRSYHSICEYGTKAGLVRYNCSFWGVIDLLAALTLVSYFLALPTTTFVRLFKLLRLIWLVKLLHVAGADSLLVRSFRRVKQELFITLFICFLLLLFASTLMHAAEGHIQPDQFGSIPRSFWWAVATLTTVGYGDVYPVTFFGKIISGFLALVGIAIVALPTGLMAASITTEIEKK